MNVKSEERPFNAVETARSVTRLALTGGFGTLGETGYPFTSLVTTATTIGGEPVLLLSKLAVHTHNLQRDPRVSLLLIGPGGEDGDPLMGARLTVVGRIAVDDDPCLAERFLSRHPEARGYAAFPDFAFYRIAVETSHLVAGFGRIVTVPPAELLVEAPAELAAAEAGAVAHMNSDHADAIKLYATGLLGLDDGPWRISGVDPLGLDLICEGTAARLDFDAPIDGPTSLRKALVDLAGRARSQAA